MVNDLRQPLTFLYPYCTIVMTNRSSNTEGSTTNMRFKAMILIIILTLCDKP